MSAILRRVRALFGTAGVPRIGWVFAAQTLVTELGFFSVFPILGVVLGRSHGWKLEEVALPVMVFTVAVRCAFLIAPQLARGAPKRWMVGSLLLTASAFFVLPVIEERWLVVALLGVAGLGISIYLTLSRACIAEETGAGGHSIQAYSLLNLAQNIAASIGPLIGGYLSCRALEASVFYLVAVGYLVAAASVAIFVPHRAPTAHGDESLRWREMVRLAFGQRRFRRFALASAAGWCLYAQLFATLPLYFAARYGASATLGTLFTVNALIVVALQLPSTGLVTRIARRPGLSFDRALGVGYALFAIAFLVLALTESRIAIYAAVAIFTFGELVFAPVCNTIVAEIGAAGQHVTFFCARSVADALGEVVGVYLGIRGLTWLLERGHGGTYWLCASIFAGVASLVTLSMLDASPPQRTESEGARL